MPRAEHQDLQLALGCVEYDMHVLAEALLMRRQGVHKALPFPAAAHELIATALLVKARSLVEFLLAVPKNGRVTVKTFGIAPSDDTALRAYFGWLSQHAVHLTWKRARDPLLQRASKYEEAVQVLRECALVCAQIRARGVVVRAERHQKRHAVLRDQLELLGIDG